MRQKGLAYSALMQHLRLVWIVFHDVGGWLFPDSLDLFEEDSNPCKEVLDFVLRLHLLWGLWQFIAANTHTSTNRAKDIHLLKTKGVAARSGLSLEMFLPCDGPVEKGLRMEGLIRGFGECIVESACFDNSFQVLMGMPEKTHCFGYHLKGWDDFLVSAWEERRMGRRVYQCETVAEVARKVVFVHLSTLRRIIKGEPQEKKARLEKLFSAELERTSQIFRSHEYNVGATVAMFKK